MNFNNNVTVNFNDYDMEILDDFLFNEEPEVIAVEEFPVVSSSDDEQAEETHRRSVKIKKGGLKSMEYKHKTQPKLLVDVRRVLYGDPKRAILGVLYFSTNNSFSTIISHDILWSVISELLTGKKMKDPRTRKMNSFTPDEIILVNEQVSLFAAKYLDINTTKQDPEQNGKEVISSYKYKAAAKVQVETLVAMTQLYKAATTGDIQKHDYNRMLLFAATSNFYSDKELETRRYGKFGCLDCEKDARTISRQLVAVGVVKSGATEGTVSVDSKRLLAKYHEWEAIVFPEGVGAVSR